MAGTVGEMTSKEIKRMNKHLTAKLKGEKVPHNPYTKKGRPVSDKLEGCREIKNRNPNSDFYEGQI